ncbi:hypothetical protein [uncultured Ruminococcus sp.]|uniref:hypothetical protein n=1 Tax=uncultured Ruminococcus sp. TaxID=165186 RepID=UPI0025F8DFA4|nr:hypothetical protein [uncultured Ruminococcus sp.]
MTAVKIFAEVFKWYSEECNKAEDCADCMFCVPRKDCFTDGDIERLIKIAEKYDTLHREEK